MATSLLEPVEPRVASIAAPSRPLGEAVAWRVRDTLASAPATFLLVAVLVAMWLLERALVGEVRGGRSIGYLAIGALPNADIVGRASPDQWWRFISSALEQDRTNPLHLMVNGSALIMVGSAMERRYGQLVMLATLVLGVFAGGATWMAASALGFAAVPDYTIGCSAGISALIGMMLVYGYRERATLGRREADSMKAQATLGIALMLLIGLVVPNLNNVAHAGGLVCGVLLAMILPSRAGRGGRGLPRATTVVLSLVLVLAVASIGFADDNLVTRLLAKS
jgi:rhomboid protease GluP